MTEKEKQMLKRFAIIINTLPDAAKDNLLFYSEGMAGAVELMKKAEEAKQKPA